MKKIYKLARVFKQKLAADLKDGAPALQMAVVFGQIMGKALAVDSIQELTNAVHPALKNAVATDLKNYALKHKLDMVDIYKSILNRDINRYVTQELENKKSENYNQNESLSWVSQEILARAKGKFDSDYGKEGRYV